MLEKKSSAMYHKILISTCLIILYCTESHSFLTRRLCKRFHTNIKIFSSIPFDSKGTINSDNKKTPSSFESTETTIGNFTIRAYEETPISREGNKNEDCGGVDKREIIYLYNTGSGWGNGAHPTTNLCLEFMHQNVQEGCILIDYGTGSGILSILAAKKGAKKCIAVDVDQDSIESATINTEINFVDNIVYVTHTKYIYVGVDDLPLADITVSNILPGALNRLSSLLWLLTKPGGMICLSGIRPHELDGIRKLYTKYADLNTEEICTQRHALYGDWVRWSFKTKIFSHEVKQIIMRSLSEQSAE